MRDQGRVELLLITRFFTFLDDPLQSIVLCFNNIVIVSTLSFKFREKACRIGSYIPEESI